MRGEQRPRRDREILLAGSATEARGTLQAPAIVGVQATAVRADGFAIGIGPADASEGHLGFLVLHPIHAGQRESLGSFGEEEVLSHRITYLL